MRRRRLAAVVGVPLVAVGSLAAVVVSGTTPQLGLDLQGGVSVVLRPTTDVEAGKLDKAVDIIRSRVDALGVAEPEIARQGETVVVDLPGVKEAERARRLIGKTAELQFRPVLGVEPVGGATQPPPATTTTRGGGAPTTTEAEASGAGDRGAGGPVLARAAVRPQATTSTTSPPTTTTTTPPRRARPGGRAPADQPITAPDREGERLYQLGPAEVTGRAVDTAQARFNQGTNQWEVLVEFTDEGSEQWDDMGRRYFQRQVAIVLDGVVQSAPTIQPDETTFQPFGGEAVISGGFGEAGAKDLALVLRFGALPVELEELSVENVSPTLGRDQLDAGIVAGLVGFTLVFVYVLAYYRALGLVVWATLGVTAVIVYAVVAWLGQAIGLTLTLAGVVGLIVSIGVAADSNIVYFERVKEELRTGRTARSAADRGFGKAFRTILAADIVTLLAAALLWFLAVGSVKGFAFYLGLATLLDLGVSYFFMHPLVALMARSRRLVESRWLGIARLPGAEVPA